MKSLYKQRNKGFTLLYSMIVTSVVLAATLSVVTLSLRQLALSSTARESQKAFYAANSAVECALYWDLQLIDTTQTLNVGGNSVTRKASLFPTPVRDFDPSLFDATTTLHGIKCNRHSIVDGKENYSDTDSVYNINLNPAWGAGDSWNVPSSCNLGSECNTTFRVMFGDSLSNIETCADVRVQKTGINTTIIFASGYNTCDPSAPNRVERGVKLVY